MASGGPARSRARLPGRGLGRPAGHRARRRTAVVAGARGVAGGRAAFRRPRYVGHPSCRRERLPDRRALRADRPAAVGSGAGRGARPHVGRAPARSSAAAMSGWCRTPCPACRARTRAATATSRASASASTSWRPRRFCAPSMRRWPPHGRPMGRPLGHAPGRRRNPSTWTAGRGSAAAQRPVWMTRESRKGPPTASMFPNFTSRMALILAHDLLAAVAAVLAAFYIRFEASGIAQRWDLLLLLLPGFVLYSAGVFSIFGLYKNKWRFTSLPDVMNIVKVSTVLAVTLLVLDYVLVAPNIYGTFFFGKITIALYWFLQVFFLAGTRVAYRYFRYTRTLQHARRRRSRAGPRARPGGRRRGAAARHRKRGGQEDPGDRHPVAVARRSQPVDPRHSGDGRFQRPRAGGAGPRQSRHRGDAPGDDAVGARAGDEARSDPDAGAPHRPDAEPDAVARRGRRGAAARARPCGGPAAAAERQDRLSPPRSTSCAARPPSSPAAAARSAPKSATGSPPTASIA